MRIAFLSLEYPPLGGGIATSLGSLAPALAERGHQVSVIGWTKDGDRSQRDGVTIELERRSSVPKLGWWLNPRKVEGRIRTLPASDRPEVVVSHDWCGPSAGMHFACPVTIWCNGSASYFSDITGEPLRERVRRAETRALRSAASVAAVSEFTASRTQELFDLSEKPRVIPNPVDVDRFVPCRLSEVAKKCFLYSGTVVRKKGVFELCQAFNRVVEKAPDAELVVAGRDSRDAMTGASSTWDLCVEQLSQAARARVRRIGFVPHDEMNQLTRSCLAAVLPSRAEALPLAWLEVMACARPVIAANVGWAPELIATGENGLLTQPEDPKVLADAMLQLLADPALAHRLGAAARARVQTSFSKEVVAEQFEVWLSEVAGT